MATPEEEVKAFKDKLGPNIDPATQQLMGMELQAGTARNTSVGPNAWANDQYDAFQGAWVPPNMDESQWQATVTAVQTWAANTDYRGIPAWGEIVGLYEWGTQNGVSMSDSRQVAAYLASKLPPDKQSQMPWAASGLNQQQYHDRIMSIGDQFQSLTGTRPPDSDLVDLQWGINQGYSDQAIIAAYKQRPDFQVGGKYGYVALGKSYDTYQQYKNDPNTRQQIVSRFGSGAINSDQAYMQSLSNPLIAPAGAGSRGSTGTQSARLQSDKTGSSQVR